MEASNLLKDYFLQTLFHHLNLLFLISVICIEFYLTFIFRLPITHLFLASLFLLLVLFFTFRHFSVLPSNSQAIYLVDFACLKPPSSCRIPSSTFIEHVTMFKCFDQDSISHMAKLVTSSGQGEETYLPPALLYIPPTNYFRDAIHEAEMLFFPVIDDLLSKTQISPLEIDVLVLNCSSFSPAPSLTSIIVNKYSMRTDIKSFNISGMGCSAGLIGINVAQNVLRVHKNYNAIVISAEILSNNWYAGNDKSKLGLNSLFRMGCSAVLLSNKKEAKYTSKYKLSQLVRTQTAYNDKSYLTATREEDSEGITGFTVNRTALQVAGETLRLNVTTLGTLILPLKEKIYYSLSIFKKKFSRGKCSKSKVYMPDFTSVVQHFCTTTSGKTVVLEIGKGLNLSGKEMEATLMTFQRFGNQSASSLWYVLAYTEAKERVKKGDKVWQIGIGSGFKCNSVAWECLRHIVNESKNGPWAQSADSINHH